MHDEHPSREETLIDAGSLAPDFTLMDQDREEWSLREALERSTRGVVLCFYPLDFTGVCGGEMEGISRSIARWQDTGYQVVGISCDSFAAHRAWADQLGLSQTLLADMHREVCKAYGLYWPDLNICRRGTVVIDRVQVDGKIAGMVRWAQAREASCPMDPDEVLGQMV